jgi:hypothetical protein
MTEIVNISFDGMGTGQNSGLYKAKAKLKNKPNGTVAICKFYNGHAAFIKDENKVRPITDKEIQEIHRG